MRTTIDIAEPLLENAKQRAAALHTTLSALVQDALRSHLSQISSQKPGNFRLHTVRGKLVQPGLDLDRTSALLALEDEVFYSGKED